MAKIHPFRPYRYTAKAGVASSLVTQPYDKIPDELREAYLAASPYNFVRLIKGKEQPGDNGGQNVYSRAAALLDQWIAEGILAQDTRPAYYPYSQQFAHPETGERIVRKGFIALAEVEDYEARVVHRHELTHRGPKVDRLRLTDATKAYFGQLFFLYDDPERRVDALLDEATAGPPLMEAEEEGVLHRVWRLDDPDRIDEIGGLLAANKLLIADGHHRYETALAYAREHPEIEGASRVMLTLVNMSSEGLVVLATHRVLDGIEGFRSETFLKRASYAFEVTKLGSEAELQAALDAAPADRSVIGGVFAGDPAAYLFSPKLGALADLLADKNEIEKRLDVVILHQALLGEALGVSEEDVRELKGIRYIRGLGAAVAEVREGRAQTAFLLRPVNVKDVAEISFSGGVMPQKSTDFYPKLLSGFTTYRF